MPKKHYMQADVVVCNAQCFANYAAERRLDLSTLFRRFRSRLVPAEQWSRLTGKCVYCAREVPDQRKAALKAEQKRVRHKQQLRKKLGEHYRRIFPNG